MHLSTVKTRERNFDAHLVYAKGDSTNTQFAL